LCRFPLVSSSPEARNWLDLQLKLGLASNTLLAYGRALEDFLNVCNDHHVDYLVASGSDIAVYVHDMAARPNRRAPQVLSMDSRRGLSNATMQQRLTAVRLFFDFLMEENLRSHNPVGRGRYTPGKAFGGKRDRGLISSYRKLPWIPDESQWRAVLEVVRGEPIRNRAMFALAYDCGLRREELCALATQDIDPSHRFIRIRAETTKGRRDRVVAYSAIASELYAAYLAHRRTLGTHRGPLFLSESRRNRADPISIWSWSKTVRRIALRASIPQFSTHTLRHLCLTDLARAGWDLHEIALFAGHKSLRSTLLYIHLSGRELAAKLEACVHELRGERLMGLEK
jgi:site-specific recombinase XerD